MAHCEVRWTLRGCRLGTVTSEARRLRRCSWGERGVWRCVSGGRVAGGEQKIAVHSKRPQTSLEDVRQRKESATPDTE
eukprot:127407-Pleurochrysis_carterae.AAC.1